MVAPSLSRSISVITVCMNREQHLLDTAPRVAAWPHHSEHLVVDWSSRQPLRREALPPDPRLRLLRVEGEQRWNLCRAYNFAIAQARGTCLFKLDADCWPAQLDDPAALADDGVICRFGSGEDGRLGQWIIDRELVERLGGFNELFWGYGFDDKDFKARLRCHTGTPVRELPETAIGVIRHSIHLRASRDAQAGFRPGPLEYSRSHALKRATSLSNRVMAAFCPWSAQAPRSRYSQDLATGSWRLEQASLPLPPPLVDQELLRLRRQVYWGRFLLLPEVVVMELPLKLLPPDRHGAFRLRWWHRLYWYTVRLACSVPVALLSQLKGSRQRLAGLLRPGRG